MILGIDIGNTNIVAGVLDDRCKVLFSIRFYTDRRKTKDEFIYEFEKTINTYPVILEKIEGVVISSVVPELTNIIYDGIAELIHCTPLVVSADICTDIIHIALDDPKTVGTDLLADAAAAAKEYTGTIAIFDMGTAVTCSVVNENKEFMGTIIMPGVKISQDALSEKAAQLPYVRFERPKHMIGRNTVESMQSGVIYGNAAMIDGLTDRLEKELNTEITVIAAGEIAKTIIPYCQRKIVYEPDLLLKGLWYIAKERTPKW